jgi:hypothetical protein
MNAPVAPTAMDPALALDPVAVASALALLERAAATARSAAGRLRRLRVAEAVDGGVLGDRLADAVAIAADDAERAAQACHVLAERLDAPRSAWSSRLPTPR